MAKSNQGTFGENIMVDAVNVATAPLRTPDNTPLPGGGSWHWDDALPGWVENPPYGEPQPSSPPIDPAQQPVLE